MQAMVVDDSKAMRMILVRILSGLGFDVCQAADAAGALAALDQGGAPVALMLIDWNMPGMTGLELVRRLREDPARRSIVLMMVTTETNVSQMVAALAAGADEYVMKPFTAEVITDKLRLLGLLEEVAEA